MIEGRPGRRIARSTLVGRVARAGVAFGAAVPGAAACAPKRAPAPLLVLAAADLREALPEIADAYRASGGGEVTIAFGASGDLALQIANGAPANVFFSADEDALARLAARGAIDARTRRVYAVGRLALVTAPRAGQAGQPAAAAVPLQLTDLARPAVRTVAIADPAHAPYGRAARDVLQHAGLWDQLSAKLVLAPNVAQAFRYVQGGNADAGLVALSAVSGRVAAGGAGARPAYVLVDTTLYAPIRQAAAVVAGTTRRADATRFLDYATGSVGFAVLRRYGFAAPAPAAAR